MLVCNEGKGGYGTKWLVGVDKPTVEIPAPMVRYFEEDFGNELRPFGQDYHFDILAGW